MKKEQPTRIVVFEHEVRKFKHDDPVLLALQSFHGKGVPYYSLVNNGVKFCEYVGVLQIGPITIEVLPKADKHSDEAYWRTLLIDMLRVSQKIQLKTTGSSHLRLRPHSILDVYITLFLDEVQRLLHRGLIKRYRSQEHNTTALKGSLMIGKNLQHNAIHKERFYVRHNIYDAEHLLHQVLREALLLIVQVARNPGLQSAARALWTTFPEMPRISVAESTFARIHLSRKTADYASALEIARLLLLNYHPDVRKGSYSVLALMFDMNLLWEQFLHATLARNPKVQRLLYQHRRLFWLSGSHSVSNVSMVPDLLLNPGSPDCIIVDAKWKTAVGKPAPEDLRQLYVYNSYYAARQSALVYPGQRFEIHPGTFQHGRRPSPADTQCHLIKIGLPEQRGIRAWQQAINTWFENWITSSSDVGTA